MRHGVRARKMETCRTDRGASGLGPGPPTVKEIAMLPYCPSDMAQVVDVSHGWMGKGVDRDGSMAIGVLAGDRRARGVARSLRGQDGAALVRVWQRLAGTDSASDGAILAVVRG